MSVMTWEYRRGGGLLLALSLFLFAPNMLAVSVLDVDDNGNLDALTDGLLVVRYLFGFSGQPLIARAVRPEAPNDTPDEVMAVLDALRVQGLPPPDTFDVVPHSIAP